MTKTAHTPGPWNYEPGDPVSSVSTMIDAECSAIAFLSLPNHAAKARAEAAEARAGMGQHIAGRARPGVQRNDYPPTDRPGRNGSTWVREGEKGEGAVMRKNSKFYFEADGFMAVIALVLSIYGGVSLAIDLVRLFFGGA